MSLNYKSFNNKLPCVPAAPWGADINAGDSRSFDSEEDRGVRAAA